MQKLSPENDVQCKCTTADTGLALPKDGETDLGMQRVLTVPERPTPAQAPSPKQGLTDLPDDDKCFKPPQLLVTNHVIFQGPIHDSVTVELSLEWIRGDRPQARRRFLPRQVQHTNRGEEILRGGPLGLSGSASITDV